MGVLKGPEFVLYTKWASLGSLHE